MVYLRHEDEPPIIFTYTSIIRWWEERQVGPILQKAKGVNGKWNECPPVLYAVPEDEEGGEKQFQPIWYSTQEELLS